MINFDVYGHCVLALTFIIHCKCFRSNMGISKKTRVVQVRIVSIPMSPKNVDISVPVPKWLKTLRTQYRSVRRHFGTDAEASGNTSALMPNWSGHFGRKTLVPKWFDTEVSGNHVDGPVIDRVGVTFEVMIGYPRKLVEFSCYWTMGLMVKR